MTDGLILALKEWGCDTEGALRRLCGDKELYYELINKYFGELDFAVLKGAAAAKDSKIVFESAHSIKGVTANLGITPIYIPICKITDIFRSGTCENVSELFDEIDKKKSEFNAILEAN